MKRNWLLTALSAMVLATVACAPSEPVSPDTEAGLRNLAKSSLAQIDGTISLKELAQPVEVLRDKWGVAHIYAKTKKDLFFAQGFVAAQDRLYQMEIWRRSGTGELAEVFGPNFVGRDRLARLVRYRGDMEAEWQSYSPDTKEIATAFTRGVNAFVRRCGDNLPVEFKLLGFRPGEWKPEDCLLRVAGLQMTRNARKEIARAKLVASLGVKGAEKYRPTDPYRKLDPDPAVDLNGLDDRVVRGYGAAITIPKLGPHDGSNNWVVDGSLSATGRPLLASDPHRAVVLPSLRYLIHLVGPGWNVIGSGEPALPGVAIGHNEKAGWGFTIVQYDQTDLYVEQTDPKDRNRYRYKGKWEEMRIEHTSIRVKGRAEPLEVDLKFTRHGPVIWEDPDKPRAVTMHWVGEKPGTAGYLGSLAMDRVGSWNEFRRAMESWKLPSENIVYADVHGDIGWIPAGLMPVRSWSGLLPVPGASGSYEWKGFLTVDQLPREHNPSRHYIATANHNILPKNYPHDLGFDWSAPYRIRRLREVLGSGSRFTVEDFERLQYDVTSLLARELVKLLQGVPAGGAKSFEQARAFLQDWNKVLDKNSAPAALYEVWVRALREEFLDSLVPKKYRDVVSENLQWPALVDLLGKTGTKQRNAILAGSLERAWEQAAKRMGADSAVWRWGMLHTIEFRHPLANTGIRAAVLNRGPIARGGDAFTVNATPGPGYSQSNGASYRHILDVGDWDHSVFTSTPGQSGQPESPNYDNLLDGWAKRDYAPLLYSRNAVEANTAHRLTLQPAAR